MWLFDLDNTLHHADAGIFELINYHMTDFLAQALSLDNTTASTLREDYWHRYGATLAGLRLHHPEISLDHFLQASHPLEPILAALVPMEEANNALATLPGRKAVLSNGAQHYVEALINAMSLTHHFEALFGTERTGYAYKPDKRAYLTACQILAVAPENCIMIDDSRANLHAAKALGMQTVWYGSTTHPAHGIDAIAHSLPELANHLNPPTITINPNNTPLHSN